MFLFIFRTLNEAVCTDSLLGNLDLKKEKDLLAFIKFKHLSELIDLSMFLIYTFYTSIFIF